MDVLTICPRVCCSTLAPRTGAWWVPVPANGGRPAILAACVVANLLTQQQAQAKAQRKVIPKMDEGHPNESLICW